MKLVLSSLVCLLTLTASGQMVLRNARLVSAASGAIVTGGGDTNAATWFYVESNTNGVATSAAPSAFFYWADVAITNAGTATKLRLYAASVGSLTHAKIGLYAGTAKQAECALTITTAGWQEGTISTSVTNGTYRIVWIADNTSFDYAYQADVGTLYYAPAGGYALDDPLPSSTGNVDRNMLVGVYVE